MRRETAGVSYSAEGHWKGKEEESENGRGVGVDLLRRVPDAIFGIDEIEV